MKNLDFYTVGHLTNPLPDDAHFERRDDAKQAAWIGCGDAEPWGVWLTREVGYTKTLVMIVYDGEAFT